MFHRRPLWGQLVRHGVPALFVLRPHAGGFTPPAMGSEYPPVDPGDKRQMCRTRQMYEQRRIGTEAELNVLLAKEGKPPRSAEADEASAAVGAAVPQANDPGAMPRARKERK